MTSFDKAFEYTMEWEGGEKYTNDPLDPGGETIAWDNKSCILVVEDVRCFQKKNGKDGQKTIGMRLVQWEELDLIAGAVTDKTLWNKNQRF